MSRSCPIWSRRRTRSSRPSRTATRDQLREELGDLLLQVLFHARMALDDVEQPFSIDDVAAGLVESWSVGIRMSSPTSR